MHSKRAEQCFRDIIIAAIDLIQAWVSETGGIDAAVHRNVLTRSTIERQLLVISEAAIRLDKVESGCAEAFAPSIDWAGVRGIGNFIRHKYDELDVAVIVETISNRLDDLKRASQKAVAAIEEEAPIGQ
jgi:uncharacterized protein with HEPN domain